MRQLWVHEKNPEKCGEVRRALRGQILDRCLIALVGEADVGLQVVGRNGQNLAELTGRVKHPLDPLCRLPQGSP